MVFIKITTFFGRLHPLLVHLPIGFLIIAIILGFFQNNNPVFRKSITLIWLLSFISASFSALMGWLLSQNGHYIQKILSLHQWFGIGLVFFSGVGWLLRLRYFNTSKLILKANNFLIAILLIIVGHFGGSLTHGDSYLYDYAPEPIKNIFISDNEVDYYKNLPLDSIKIYENLINPLFTEKCVACHNNEISRGELNMTSAEKIFKGGRSGSAIIPGYPEKSHIYSRVVRSQNDERFMPPTGPPLSYREIKLIEWWISNGAPLNKSIPELSLSEEIQFLLLKSYNIDSRPKPWFENVKLMPLNEDIFNEFEKNNFSIRTLSVENTLLDIRFQGSQITKKHLALLTQYAPYITWLNLSKCMLSGKQVESLSKMENLTRLYIQKNRLTTNDIFPLKNLKHLEILNLHSTQVDRNVFEIVESIRSLKKVYLWNTLVSSDQIQKKDSQFNNLEIIGKSE